MDVKFFRFNLAFEADELVTFERCPAFGFAFGFVELRVTGICAKRNNGSKASNRERNNLCFIILYFIQVLLVIITRTITDGHG